jgi:hypothetical protein
MQFVGFLCKNLKVTCFGLSLVLVIKNDHLVPGHELVWTGVGFSYIVTTEDDNNTVGFRLPHHTH